MRYLLWIFLVILVACGPDTPVSDTNSSAEPTPPTAFDPASLAGGTAADSPRVRLRPATALSTEIGARDEGLLVLQFWSLDCTDCQKQNTTLAALGVPTIYVNMDPISQTAAVNQYLQSAGLTGTHYQLTEPQAVLPLLDGPVPPLPYFRVLDQVNGVELDYHQYLGEAALEAVLGAMVGG